MAIVALALLYAGMLIRFSAPGFTAGDSPELSAACVTFGSAHAPGYPLFVVLGRAAQSIPAGTPAFRITWIFILAQTLAFLMLSTLLNLYLKSRFPNAKTGQFSILTAFFSMISPLTASQSTSPEVYSLALLAVVFLLSCMIRPDLKSFRLASFGFGLALAHHHLVFLLLPAMAWSFRDFLKRPKWLFFSASLMVFGLSLYSVLPIRSAFSPFSNWGQPGDFRQLWFHVSRAQYGGNLRPGSILDGLADLGVYLKDLALETWVLGLVFIVIGLWRSRREFLTGPTLAFIGMLFGTPLLIRVPAAVENARIMESFFPPMLALATPFLALGVLDLFERLKHPTPRRIAGVVLIGLVVLRLPTPGSGVDQSRNLSGEDLGRDILQILPRGSVLYSEGDTATFPLAYLKGVGGLRPDAEVFDRTGGLFQDLYGLLKAERKGWGRPPSEMVMIERAHEASHPHSQVFYTEKEGAPGRALEYAGLVFRVTGDGEVRPIPRPPFNGWRTLRPPRVLPSSDYLSREAGTRFHLMKGEYLGGKDDEAARLAFSEAKRLGFDNARLFINIGVSHLENDRVEEALEAFNEAVRLSPRFALAWYDRGYALSKLKDPEGSVRAYEEAIRLDPFYTAARNNLAYQLMELRRGNEAVAQWEAILRYDPGFVTAYRDLGLVMFDSRPDQARAYLERYLALSPPGPGPDQVRRLLATHQR